ncbi:MAG: hypothetical protein RIR70_2260 [Pseudomonadota bacterium]|jgi:hypothetical protein
MDDLGAVSAIDAGRDKQLSAALEGVVNTSLSPHSLDPLQMVPPGGDAQSHGVTFGDKVWTNLDKLSTQMKEVHEAVRSSIGAPQETAKPSGDMVHDMKSELSFMQAESAKLLTLQMKMHESGGVFNIGVGMVHSIQQSARTLLQDK